MRHSHATENRQIARFASTSFANISLHRVRTTGKVVSKLRLRGVVHTNVAMPCAVPGMWSHVCRLYMVTTSRASCSYYGITDRLFCGFQHTNQVVAHDADVSTPRELFVGAFVISPTGELPKLFDMVSGSDLHVELGRSTIASPPRQRTKAAIATTMVILYPYDTSIVSTSEQVTLVLRLPDYVH